MVTTTISVALLLHPGWTSTKPGCVMRGRPVMGGGMASLSWPTWSQTALSAGFSLTPIISEKSPKRQNLLLWSSLEISYSKILGQDVNVRPLFKLCWKHCLLDGSEVNPAEAPSQRQGVLVE